MKQFEPLTDLQWQVIEPLFPVLQKRGRGKPHASWRSVLNSILLVLFTGTKWAAIPKVPDFASKSAAHRWFVVWKKNGFLDQILNTLRGLSEMVSQLQFPSTRQRLPKSLSDTPLESAAI